MDFDKPKVYGDTSITDGLVSILSVDRGRDSNTGPLHLLLLPSPKLEGETCLHQEHATVIRVGILNC